MASETDYETFVERLRRQGFEPGEESLRAMWGALPALEAIRARVRRRFEHTDEPAHVFSARGEP